jgi:uncharacterized protein YndB with AHSA1/START domain
MPPLPKDNEIHLVRFYDAPLSAVWKAWTDPVQAAQWWGPRGFTITNHRKDLRVGGQWHYTMHGPAIGENDGVDYPNIATYLEIENEAKLVYDHGATETEPALFRVTVLFSQAGNKTKMDMTMTLPSKEAADQTRQIIKNANGNSTWDRLSEYLEKQKSGKDIFIINRSFAAPIDVVFDAWSDPKKIAEWLSPTGTSMEYFTADIRAGGTSTYKMGNDQFTMYGRAAYIKVEPPHHLIYTQQFTDKDGNVSRHPFAPVWPETMLTHVDFTALDDHTTLVSVTWEATGNYTPEELEFFINARAGMTMGWTGSFDKFDAFLLQK